jgi:hypothetical protein
MNERILELAIQAREYAESKPDIYAVAYDKKFAELIIQECVNVIEKNHPEFTCKEDQDNLIRKAGRMDAIDEIWEHFGECEHEWVSAKNPVVTNGSICAKCFKLDKREPEEL